MEFIPNYNEIDSSQIKAVDYDYETQEMYVQFKNGAEYKYLCVLQEEYSNFMGSESKGKYFSSFIKNKNFKRVINKCI